MLGWHVTLLTDWSDRDLGRLLGVDRDADFSHAEREEPDCIAIVSARPYSARLSPDPSALLLAVARGSWRGVANRLSAGQVEWPAIDEVAEATRYPGQERCEGTTERGVPGALAPLSAVATLDGRGIVLSRRSAVAFDGRGTLPRDLFFSMLRRLRPPGPPWDAINWPPQVHLVLFVHRVDGLDPGIYAYLRDDEVLAEWRSAMRQEFLWEPVPNGPNASNDPNDLFLLVPIDCGSTAMRLSCDQEIAADGFFSLAMVARVEGSLRDQGEWFYRRLFWECGVIGQVLYLEAEAAGGRATGIGCFYDDPVHALLGLTGHGWQSLYHFSMGTPVDDSRLTTEPGYAWEAAVRAR